MVGNLSNSNSGNSDNSNGNRGNQANPVNELPVRVIANHNFDHNRIRELIQGALGPIPVDPVPTKIVIKDIVITNSRDRGLSINCQVLFERNQVNN